MKRDMISQATGRGEAPRHGDAQHHGEHWDLAELGETPVSEQAQRNGECCRRSDEGRPGGVAKKVEDEQQREQPCHNQGNRRRTKGPLDIGLEDCLTTDGDRDSVARVADEIVDTGRPLRDVLGSPRDAGHDERLRSVFAAQPIRPAQCPVRRDVGNARPALEEVDEVTRSSGDGAAVDVAFSRFHDERQVGTPLTKGRRHAALGQEHIAGLVRPAAAAAVLDEVAPDEGAAEHDGTEDCYGDEPKPHVVPDPPDGRNTLPARSQLYATYLRYEWVGRLILYVCADRGTPSHRAASGRPFSLDPSRVRDTPP